MKSPRQFRSLADVDSRARLANFDNSSGCLSVSSFASLFRASLPGQLSRVASSLTSRYRGQNITNVDRKITLDHPFPTALFCRHIHSHSSGIPTSEMEAQHAARLWPSQSCQIGFYSTDYDSETPQPLNNPELAEERCLLSLRHKTINLYPTPIFQWAGCLFSLGVGTTIIGSLGYSCSLL